MSCCGNKRREWLKKKRHTQPSKETETIDSTNIPAQTPKIFEYKGKRSLKIKGISGRTFYFRYSGYRLEVPYEDTFALMAEKDLKVHSGDMPFQK